MVQLRLDSNGVARIAINYNGHQFAKSATTPFQSKSAILAINSDGDQYSPAIRDFPNLFDQYDQIKCAGVKLKYYPAYPPGSAAALYTPMTVQYDRDGVELAWDFVNNTVERSLEQVNQVKTLNQYQPWTFYRKAVKNRINTIIPTAEPGTGGLNIDPNQNLSGRWMETFANGTDADSRLSFTSTANRGSHIQVLANPISGDQVTGDIVGTVLVTMYHVFKDRR